MSTSQFMFIEIYQFAAWHEPLVITALYPICMQFSPFSLFFSGSSNNSKTHNYPLRSSIKNKHINVAWRHFRVARVKVALLDENSLAFIFDRKLGISCWVSGKRATRTGSFAK